MEQPNNRTVKPAPPLMETTIFSGYERVGLFITSHAAPLWPVQNTSSCDPPRHSLELLSNARAKNAGTKKPRRPKSAGLASSVGAVAEESESIRVRVVPVLITGCCRTLQGFDPENARGQFAGYLPMQQVAQVRVGKFELHGECGPGCPGTVQ